MVAATATHKAAVSQLLELYAHDFSELDGADVDNGGRFGYPYTDAYWKDPDRHAFVIQVDGRLAGFVFVRSGDPHDMAEFFVMRKYRHAGVGTAVARDVFRRFPGNWQVRQIAANVAATAFWRKAIPVPFEERTSTDGTVQFFPIAPSDGAYDG